MSKSLRSAEFTSRGLNDWYLSINRIYLDRNFHRDRFEIFTHLTETVGALSLLGSDKKKQDVDPLAFLPKVLAWWMALCGKIGIRDIADLVWWKFPNCCPYCYRRPHTSLDCKTGATDDRLDWRRLDEFAKANLPQRPRRLSEWQRMFFEIYPVNKEEKLPSIFARFTEELGELAETLRVAPVAPGYFISEAADVFAWLMHLQNRIDLEAGARSTTLGQALERAFADAYPDRCRDCKNPVCTCRPILPGTLGRIAHELPEGRASFVEGGNLISIDEAIALFATGNQEVRIENQSFPVDLPLLHELRDAIIGLRGELLSQGSDLLSHSSQLRDAIAQVEGLALSQRLTQESVDGLADAIARLPSEPRQLVLGFLSSFAAGPWSVALIELVKRLAGS